MSLIEDVKTVKRGSKMEPLRGITLFITPNIFFKAYTVHFE
jgi:hypothetical protein